MNGSKNRQERNIRYFQEETLHWYAINGRRYPWRNKSMTNYQIIIAEILLQRTQADTVASYFPRFIKKYPSWSTIRHESIDDLGEMLKPIGLWKRRAQSLRLLAIEMENRKGRFPRSREEIEALPGVGQYIANAIELLCYGKPLPLLDSNMARVLERYFGPRKLVDIRYDPYLQKLGSQVVDYEKPILLNWAILDLAAIICRKGKPQCDACPLRKRCGFCQTLREESLK